MECDPCDDVIVAWSEIITHDKVMEHRSRLQVDLMQPSFSVLFYLVVDFGRYIAGRLLQELE